MKSKIINLFTVLVIVLTAVQGLIPAIPLANEVTITIVSSVVMFLASSLTVWKQTLSVEINNSAMGPTIFVAIIATIGGLNDVFGVIHISDAFGQWIRFGITAITMVLNMVSKIMWPTPETKSLI